MGEGKERNGKERQMVREDEMEEREREGESERGRIARRERRERRRAGEKEARQPVTHTDSERSTVHTIPEQRFPAECTPRPAATSESVTGRGEKRRGETRRSHADAERKRHGRAATAAGKRQSGRSADVGGTKTQSGAGQKDGRVFTCTHAVMIRVYHSCGVCILRTLLRGIARENRRLGNREMKQRSGKERKRKRAGDECPTRERERERPPTVEDN